MSHPRACVALLTAIVLLFCFGGGCGTTSPTAMAKAPKWSPEVHQWPENPVVKVCSSAPVTAAEVQWALDLWAQNGAPQLTALPSYCYSKAEPYTVYVDRPTIAEYSAHWTEKTVGLTSVYKMDMDAPPIAADLHLISDDRRILLHEVGHLWIPAHYPGTHHVMAEWLSDFDTSFRGVKRLF